MNGIEEDRSMKKNYKPVDEIKILENKVCVIIEEDKETKQIESEKLFSNINEKIDDIKNNYNKEIYGVKQTIDEIRDNLYVNIINLEKLR
jgi:hypothetical protein